jgi:CheY-like chemotaxis protein
MRQARIVPAGQDVAPSTGATLARGRSAPPLVLLVDDFADNREMYADYLTFVGYRVVQASDGHEALQKAHDHLPAAIVMDLSLPVLDGWEATRRLKAHPATKHIPIVVLTGHALTGTERSVRAAGADDYLTKPCLPDTLVDRIGKLLNAAA